MRDSGSDNKMKKLRPWTWYVLCLWATFFLWQLPCNAANVGDKNDGSKKDKISITEKKWGIRPLSIQLTAAGNLLDYRFRVIDPDKALALMKRGDNAYIIDQTSGMKLTVPRTKVGPLRQTGSKPKAGKIYPILFANTAKVIKPGSKVTLVIGDFRMENIVIGTLIPNQAELPQAKQAKWQGVKKMLGDERSACKDDCGQDQNCFDKCEKAFSGRLAKEYQSLFYEK